MTRQTPLAALIAATLALPLYAMSERAAELDANGDGLLTIDEVQAAYPDVTAESFAEMDLNADGALEEDEIAAAEEAGLMPGSDG